MIRECNSPRVMMPAWPPRNSIACPAGQWSMASSVFHCSLLCAGGPALDLPPAARYRYPFVFCSSAPSWAAPGSAAWLLDSWRSCFRLSLSATSLSRRYFPSHRQRVAELFRGFHSLGHRHHAGQLGAQAAENAIREARDQLDAKVQQRTANCSNPISRFRRASGSSAC